MLSSAIRLTTYVGLPIVVILGMIFVVPMTLPAVAIGSAAEPLPTSIAVGAEAVPPMPTPPPKDYCGEDIQKLFASWLATSAASRFMTKVNINDGSFDSSPMGRGIDEITKERDLIEQRLRDKNCFFYSSKDGSVFMDYKIIRDLHFPLFDKYVFWVETNLNMNMTAEQIMAACLAQVKTWWP